MNLAYCYFGLLRSAKACLPSHKRNLPKILESDIFVHTWYQSSITSYWHGRSIETFCGVLRKLAGFSDLNVRKIVLEEQKAIPGNDLVEINEEKVHWKSGVYLWKTILASAELVREYAEKNGRYDRVIFLRPDLEIKSLLSAQKILNSGDGLLFCGAVDDSKLPKKIYRCEDLIFSINFSELDNFIDFCKKRIDAQYLLEKSILLNGHNPLLEFSSSNNSSPVFLEFVYPRDFEIRRNIVFWFPLVEGTYKKIIMLLKYLKNV